MLTDGVEVASVEVDEVEVEVEVVEVEVEVGVGVCVVEELVALDEEVEVWEAVVDDEPPAVPLGAFGREIYPNRPFLVFPQLS